MFKRSVHRYDTGRRIITAMPPFAEWDRSFPADARRQRLSAAQVNVKRAVARLARGEWAVGEGGPPGRPRARLAYARDASSHSGGSAQDRAAILQAGGWKDASMVQRYIRKLGALEGGGAVFREGAGPGGKQVVDCSSEL